MGRKARQRLSHKGLILPQRYFCSFTVQYFSPSLSYLLPGEDIGFHPGLSCLLLPLQSSYATVIPRAQGFLVTHRVKSNSSAQHSGTFIHHQAAQNSFYLPHHPPALLSGLSSTTQEVVQISALIFIKWVTLSKLFDLSEPPFPLL